MEFIIKNFIKTLLAGVGLAVIWLLMLWMVVDYPPQSAFAATQIEQSRCSAPVVVGAANDEWYSVSAGNAAYPVSIFFEPDISGAGSTGGINIQACMIDATATSCRALDYDSDGNGTPDTNVITGDTMATSGVAGITGIPYLRVQTQTSPGAEAARYVICRGL